MQRFISEDPIHLYGGDVNLYAYVANSPLNFTDPTGEFLVNLGPHLQKIARVATFLGQLFLGGSGGKIPPGPPMTPTPIVRPVKPSNISPKLGRALAKAGKAGLAGGIISGVIGELVFPNEANAGSDVIPPQFSTPGPSQIVEVPPDGSTQDPPWDTEEDWPSECFRNPRKCPDLF
jgi:hypothetical protein